MSTVEQAREQMDTRVRPKSEVVARLIRPIPAKLIDQKDTGKYKADYVNVTTRKDLLDAACGFGNWKEEIVSTVYMPPNHFGMILRLSILTSDHGWMSHDGTGYEATDNRGPGDPFSNAYAQALGRAAEGFGMARELWRGETIRSQGLAAALIRAGAFEVAPSAEELPKAPPDEEQAHVGRELRVESDDGAPELDVLDSRNDAALDVRADAPEITPEIEEAAKRAAAEKEPPADRDLQHAAVRIITASGVKKDGGRYIVVSEGGARTDFVTKDERGAVQCSCPGFTKWTEVVEKFRCEHMRAAKLYADTIAAPKEHETRWACSEENQRRVLALALQAANTKPAPGVNVRALTFDESLTAIKQQYKLKTLADLTDAQAAESIRALEVLIKKLKGDSSSPSAPAAKAGATKSSPAAPSRTTQRGGAARPAPSSSSSSAGGRKAAGR